MMFWTTWCSASTASPFICFYFCWCYFSWTKYHFFFSLLGKIILNPQGQAPMLLLQKAHLYDPWMFNVFSATLLLWHSTWQELEKKKGNRTKDMKVMKHCKQLLCITTLINVRVSRRESKYQILTQKVKPQLKPQEKNVLKRKDIKFSIILSIPCHSAQSYEDINKSNKTITQSSRGLWH